MWKLGAGGGGKICDGIINGEKKTAEKNPLGGMQCDVKSRMNDDDNDNENHDEHDDDS